MFAVAKEECGEDGEGADEAEEFKPLPLGEEPVVAGFLCGDDRGGFGGSNSLENGREGECGERKDCVGARAVAQAGEAQDEHEGEGVGGHEGMEGGGYDEAESGREQRAERGAVVEGECDGEKRERSGEAAAGDVGVHEEERRAGDGERPEGGEKNEGGELRGLAGDGALEDAVRGVEGEPEAEEVGE